MSVINQRDLEDFLKKEIPYQADKDVIFDYIYGRLSKGSRPEEYQDAMIDFINDALEYYDDKRKLSRDPFDNVVDILSFYGAGTLLDDKETLREVNDRDYARVKDMAEEAELLSQRLMDWKEEMEDERGGSRRGRSRDSRYDRDYDRRGSRREERGPSRSKYSDRQRSGRDDRDRDSRGSRRSNYYEDHVRENDREYGRRDSRGPRESKYSSSRHTMRSEVPGARRDVDGQLAALEAMERSRAAAKARAEGSEGATPSYQSKYHTPNKSARSAETYDEVPAPNPFAGKVKSYEQVDPSELGTLSGWSQRALEEDQRREAGRTVKFTDALPPSDRALSLHEMTRVYDITNPEVIMAVLAGPVDNGGRKLGVDLYEVDAVRPEWYINKEDGLRYVRYIPLTEEEKQVVRREIHKLPVLGLEFGNIRQHPQNEMLRNALVRPRFDLEGARNVHDEDVAIWKAEVEAIRSENEGKPEEQQREVPVDAPVSQVNPEQTIKLRGTVKGFGFDHVKVVANQRAAKHIEAMGDKTRHQLRSVHFRGESYRSLFVAKDPETAQAMVDTVKIFEISDNFEIVAIEDIHGALSNATMTLPVPIISAIRRHVVQTVNNTFKYEMGSRCRIEEFDDLLTLGKDMRETMSEEFVKLFARAFGDKLINLQLLKVGSGVEGTDEDLDACTIYAVTRADVIILPLVARDLNITVSDVKDENEIYLIDKDKTPQLNKVVDVMNLNSVDNLNVRRLLLLADNNVAEIRRDGLNQRAGVIQLTTEQE